MKYCCNPKSQELLYVYHDLLGRTLYCDYINTGKHKFHLIRETQYIMYFHSKTHQRLSPSPPNLSSLPSPPPPPPPPPHTHTVSHLVVAWHKVPFSDIVALPYSEPSWSTAYRPKFVQFKYELFCRVKECLTPLHSERSKL